MSQLINYMYEQQLNGDFTRENLLPAIGFEPTTFRLIRTSPINHFAPTGDLRAVAKATQTFFIFPDLTSVLSELKDDEKKDECISHALKLRTAWSLQVKDFI